MNACDRFWLATRKGLFRFRRGRTGRWSASDPAFHGAAVNLVNGDPGDGSIYACLEHGHFGAKLHRSVDGGRTWEERAAPVYPKRKRTEPKVDGMGKPWQHSLVCIWALEPDPRTAGGLWCGTIPGGLFHSADGGGSWHLVRGLWDHPERGGWCGGGKDLAGLHSICVDPRNADRITVAVSIGGVYRSADGGGTWEQSAHGMVADYMPEGREREPAMQDPHRIVQCGSAPDRFWCQHHNGIFQSRNGARRWSRIRKAGPSTFGFGVAVHPDDPDTAWFVPGVKDEVRTACDGRLVVTRTRDGGKTFDVLERGLPQKHAYDIVLRHALDVDPSGRRLVFGTTTGAVFVSENGGASWECLGAHFPPVYGVRFF